jgi:hypothetical protein
MKRRAANRRLPTQADIDAADRARELRYLAQGLATLAALGAAAFYMFGL